MTAAERLTRALVGLATQGRRPRCSEPGGHELWCSDDADDRAQAATWCAGCPLLDECGAAADENDERFGVFGGTDRTPPPAASRRCRSWRGGVDRDRDDVSIVANTRWSIVANTRCRSWRTQGVDRGEHKVVDRGEHDRDDEQDERFNVWGGRDRTPASHRRYAVTTQVTER